MSTVYVIRTMYDYLEYKALYKFDQLVYGDPLGRAVIVCGWQPKEKVAERVPKGSFAALGQLYSSGAGLSILIRNLLYNPQIDIVAYTPPTKQDQNAGSIAALLAFFENGVIEGKNSAKRDCWKTIGAAGEIDREIPLEALKELRDRVEVRTLPDYLAGLPLLNRHRPEKSALDVAFATRQPQPLEPLQRRIFPVASVDGERLPGQYIGHRIEAKTIAEAFPHVMHRIRTTGRIRPNGHGGYWQELLNMMIVITDEPIGLHFEPFLPVSPDYLKEYVAQMTEGLNGKVSTVKYTYGSRMREYFGFDQIAEVIDKLADEPAACSAVMNLWDAGGIRPDKSSDHKHGGSPCLNQVWVRIIDGQILTLTAVFRSNDMYGAWVANIMGLRKLQQLITEALVDRGLTDLSMGEIVTLSQSAHVYDHSFEAADFVSGLRNLRPTYQDSVGNFLLSWDNQSNKCYIAQEYPQGVAAKEFRGTNPLKLIREVCNSSPGISPDHAAYLALEVVKCLEQKEQYRQDS